MEDIKPLPFGLRMPVAERAPSLTVSVAVFELMQISLAGHAYGIPLNCVVDVRDAQPPLQFFNRPRCMVGSLWIAGEHAPVIDLRLALGLQPARGSRHPIIAIDIGERVIGVVVDSVGEVLAMPANTVARADTSGPVEPRFLRGQARTGQSDTLSLLGMVDWLHHLNDLFEITPA